jgi:hypothetical protein
VNDRSRPPAVALDTFLRLAIVALALGTAYIHLTLGGLRFTLNAGGYLVLALALVAPVAIARRHRWLIRIGLAGYAAATIIGWALEPAFYTTAYIAKGIELAILVLLVIDIASQDGNPVDRLRHGRRSSQPVR